MNSVFICVLSVMQTISDSAIVEAMKKSPILHIFCCYAKRTWAGKFKILLSLQRNSRIISWVTGRSRIFNIYANYWGTRKCNWSVQTPVRPPPSPPPPPPKCVWRVKQVGISRRRVTQSAVHFTWVSLESIIVIVENCRSFLEGIKEVPKVFWTANPM